MSEEALVDAVGAVVLAADGRVLLVQRGKPPLEGEWTLVGGHIEPGESHEDAARREVREETALEIDVLEPLVTVVVGRYRIHEMSCAPKDGAAKPVAGDDARDVCFARYDELEALGVRPEAREVIALALRRSLRPGLRK